MAELGLMGLNIPEEYGGFGASAMMFNRVFGEIGATDPALTRVLRRAPDRSAAKASRCSEPTTRKNAGSRNARAANSSPRSVSRSRAPDRTRRRCTPPPCRAADGKSYTLNGQKIWISNAGYAGVFTVFAKVPVEIDGKPKQRVTAFIVDAHAPGVSLGKIEEKMGIKASDTRAVTFENVRVPAEDMIGEVGHGFKIALEILNSGRLGLAAGSARGTRRILDVALGYAKQREQFGRPIGSFEMIQRKFADRRGRVLRGRCRVDADGEHGGQGRD